jgi:riboflavin transporter FmnP
MNVVDVLSRQSSTIKLTGTAILAALVIVFDFALKYSGLKLPFPWYPNLKFDFTGIPIALSLFLYGFPSSVMTSLVAGIGIVARSGNVISATMKVAAELSTVVGLHLGRQLVKNGSRAKYASWGVGLVSRILVMTVVNFYVLPNVYNMPMKATIGLLPLIGIFNALQGAITIGLGYFLYEAVKSRLPQWTT